MTARTEKLEQAVASVLEKRAQAVRRAGRQHWDFALSNGRPVQVSARIQDEWLVMHAPLTGETGNWWELLRLNGRINGSAKFALAGRTQPVCLRAEIPTDEEVDVPLRLHEWCHAFQFALERFHAGQGVRSRSSKTAAKRPTKTSKPDHHGAGGFDLQALCEGTGWSFNQREDGSVAFDLTDLSARESFHQALARKCAPKGVSVSVELTACSDLSSASRRALSLMLLRASCSVRGVRAAVETRDHAEVVRFEAVYASPPSPTEFEHALGALAVACDLCGAETGALQDEAIAKTYLRLQLPAVKSQEFVIESVGIGKTSVVTA